MKKIQLFSILVIFTFSCEIGNISINGLEKYELEYDELPNPVKQVFSGEFEISENNSHLLIPIDQNSRYELLTKKTGPFVDYQLIKDKEENVKYKVPYGKAFPYVIFENQLFIAKDYNVSNIRKAKSSGYEKYTLTEY